MNCQNWKNNMLRFLYAQTILLFAGVWIDRYDRKNNYACHLIYDASKVAVHRCLWYNYSDINHAFIAERSFAERARLLELYSSDDGRIGSAAISQ